MSKELTLIPVLRFPEFEFDPEWDVPNLKDISVPITEKVGSQQLTTVSITAGVGFVSQLQKFSRDISGEQYKNYFVLKEGAFAYNRGNSKKYPQGCVYKLKEFKLVAAPYAFICFRFKSGYVADFYVYYFDNNYHGEQLRKFITSGARSNGLLNISSEDFFSITLPTPRNKMEQQKIADCLSSLDELIAAEGDKLVALKQHKKGLMQQLFPAEGETVPVLRFGEFEGEWEEKTLGELVSIQSGYSPSSYHLANTGKHPFLKVEDLNNTEKYQTVSRQYCDNVADAVAEKSVIFPKRGAAIQNNKVRININKVLMDSNLMALTPNAQIDFEFLYYTILKLGLYRIADTSTIPQINNKHIIPYKILIPDGLEQKRIANCLSSIDDLITKQIEKIEQLKLHKSGLMQQLFPAINEITYE